MKKLLPTIILLCISLLIATGEFALLEKQSESIAYLESTPKTTYPSWDVPETETAEEREVRLSRYRAASVEDGILLLLTFVLCPLGIAVCVAAGALAIGAVKKFPKEKKALPVIMAVLCVLPLLYNIYVIACQMQIG